MRACDHIHRGFPLAALTLILAAAPLRGQDAAGSTSTRGAIAAPTASSTAMIVPPPAPLPISTADVDPGHPVYYDLDTGRLEEALPFDVQFYLRIPVADSVTSLTGRYVGDTESFLCQEALSNTHAYTDYGFGPREPAASQRRQVQPIGLARIFKDPTSPLPGKKDTLHAELNVVNGLLPNRYYCFEFTRLTRVKVDPEIFRQDLAAAVDLTLRKLDQPQLNLVERRFYEQLRLAIAAAIRNQLKPGERLVGPSGSFLDERTTTRSLSAESKRTFDQLLATQISRGQQIANLTAAAQRALPFLTGAVRGAALPALARAAAQEPLPAALASVFAGKDDALQLADLHDLSNAELGPILAALALGTQAFPFIDSETTTPLDQSWVPEDLKNRKTNLERTLAALRELSKLTGQLSQSQGLRQQALVQETDLSALNNDLSQGLGELVGVNQTIGVLSNRLDRRRRFLDALIPPILNLAEEIVEVEIFLVEGSTTASYEVRANWYLGMDLGAAWSPDIEDFFTYVGANIYFRPVNKKAPLRWSDFRRGQRRSELMKRLSLTIGVVLNDLKRDGQFQGLSQEDLTQGLIADKPMVAAGGFRLSDFFRVSVGALVFKDRNPDPLINDSRLAWSPLLSLSIDWNLRGFLRDRLTQRP